MQGAQLTGTLRGCAIEFCNQSLDLRHACRISGTDDQSIAARLGHHAALEAPLSRCTRLSRCAARFE